MPVNFGRATYLIQLALDKTGATQFKRLIEGVSRNAQRQAARLGQGNRLLERSYRNLGRIGGVEMKKITRVVRDANGHLKQQEFIVGRVNGTWQRFGRTTRGTSAALARFNSRLKATTAGLIGATRRALIVIPVWLALRSLITGFFTAIREGATHIIDFDAAMARAKAVMTGTREEIEAFSEELTVVARRLAGETGRSIDSIVELFYRMATAGLDNTEALAGMETALKTSIAIMGDATQTAILLADVYNLMGTRIEGAITPNEKMQKIAGTIAVLWKDNAFTLDEFTGALKTFVPTAKNYNLTLDETLGITATAATLMSRGATAGTQLSRSLIQLRDNADAVEKVLGRQVKFADVRPYDLLIEVLETLADNFARTGDIADDVIAIFGIKGSKTIQSFSSDLSVLVRNMKELNEVQGDERFDELLEKYKLQDETIKFQIGRFKELRKQTVEGFLEAVTGAGDYVEALKEVNNFMNQQIIPSAIALGELLRQPLGFLEASGEIRKAFSEANADLNRLPPRRPIPGPLGGSFVNPFEESEFETALKNFETRFKDAIPEEKLRILVEELNLSREAALSYLSVVDRTAISLERFRKGVAGRGGKSQDTQDAEDQADAEKKMKDLLDDQNKNKKEIEQTTSRQLVMAQRLAAFGATELQVELEKLRILKQRNETSEDAIKQEEKILELLIKQTNQVSEALQNTFKEGLSDVFQGEGGFEDLFRKVGEQIKSNISDALAEVITQQIFTDTGFGGIFGEFITSLRNANLTASQKMQLAIVQGGEEAGEVIKRKMLEAAGEAGGEGQAAGAGLGGATGIPGPAGKKINEFLNRKFFAKEGAGKTDGLLQGGGLSIGGALSIYGAVQTAQGLAKSGPGSGDVFGNAITGATSGALAGYAIGGPIGAGIGAIIGGIYGAVQGGRSKTESSIDQQTLTVASKIDVTNKKLDIINRNFVALKTNIETYILPDTAYFSTNRNLEDNFSINARRGFT